MGNADLRDVAACEPVDWTAVSGWTVAVDAHNWLYRYLTTTVKFTADGAYTTSGGDEVANLIGMVDGVAKLLEHDLVPVFVFDGGTADLKQAEVERRREQREEIAERQREAAERGDAVEAARLDAHSQRLTDVIHETSRGLLDRLSIPVVEAPAEGEAQAAHMAAGGYDAAATEDYDAMLFGAPTTLRQVTTAGTPERLSLADTLADLDLTREQLVDVAILAGTDYNDGVDGVGPKTAVELVREHGDLDGALDAREASIPHADRIQRLFLDPAVTDDYPTEPSVDVDADAVAAARSYVVEEWEVDRDEVETGFERIEAAVEQTGLDRWT